MLGDCWLALNRPAEARDAYYRAAELSPLVTGAWLKLAKAALALGDLPRAILSARKALSLTRESM